MKKLIALLLVLCTVFGLVACGGKKPAENPGGNATTPTGGAANADPANDPQVNMTPDKSPYNGKTLQIYGLGNNESYTDYAEFGKGNYLWMEKAAMEEWAAMNGVTLEWKGAYNQSGILADMSSGGAPDLVLHADKFPAISNAGITSAFTEDEYNKLATVCDPSYLNMLNIGTARHGVVRPWTGTIMMYFNKTMFENYGVKTPREYYDEGQWNWTNFMKCLEEMTKDLDSDGVIDTYGMPSDSFSPLVNSIAFNEKGEIISTIDEPWMQDFIQMKYDAYTVKKLILAPGKNQIQTNVIYPMYAMQISDCEPYNFEHLYQGLPNGDELEVVPIPEWVGKNGEKLSQSQLNQSVIHITSTCDEREATMDMLIYLLKCGQKYVSDFSLGSVKCDYVGIQGKCDLSKQWKEAFTKVCADRAKAIKKIDTYDEEYVSRMNEYLSVRKKYVGLSSLNIKGLGGYTEFTQMPPASAIPVVKPAYQAQLDVYNQTYVNKK